MEREETEIISNTNWVLKSVCSSPTLPIDKQTGIEDLEERVRQMLKQEKNKLTFCFSLPFFFSFFFWI